MALRDGFIVVDKNGSSDRIGIAVVGLGELSRDEILPAFQNSKYCRLAGLVSGDREKASELAAQYGLPATSVYTYDTFAKIADNKEIDAVFIVLPNSMHADYTLHAFQLGKHVLCEKPMATSVEECEQMIAAAKQFDRKLMIAYRLQYEPLNLQASTYAQSLKFGRVRTLTGSNMQQVEGPNIRLESDLGGGPVGDVGIYCINAARYITGENPIKVYATSHHADTERFSEVPSSVSFILKFPSGVQAACTCGFAAHICREFTIHCEEATIRMEQAYAYNGLRLTVEHDGQVEEIERESHDQFAAEMDYFAECISSNSQPKSDGWEGLIDIAVIAAIHQSIREDRPIKIDYPLIEK